MSHGAALREGHVGTDKNVAASAALVKLRNAKAGVAVFRWGTAYLCLFRV